MSDRQHIWDKMMGESSQLQERLHTLIHAIRVRRVIVRDHSGKLLMKGPLGPVVAVGGIAVLLAPLLVVSLALLGALVVVATRARVEIRLK